VTNFEQESNRVRRDMSPLIVRKCDYRTCKGGQLGSSLTEFTN
jgi:hypothetical protein